MPLLNTTPATSCCGMLSNENRVTSHWSLFTIVFRILRSYSGFNEIDSVLPDCIDTFISDILSILVGKFEFGSEFGFFEGGEFTGNGPFQCDHFNKNQAKNSFKIQYAA